MTDKYKVTIEFTFTTDIVDKDKLVQLDTVYLNMISRHVDSMIDYLNHKYEPQIQYDRRISLDPIDNWAYSGGKLKKI